MSKSPRSRLYTSADWLRDPEAASCLISPAAPFLHPEYAYEQIILRKFPCCISSALRHTERSLNDSVIDRCKFVGISYLTCLFDIKSYGTHWSIEFSLNSH